MDPKQQFSVLFSVFLSGCALEASDVDTDTAAFGQSEGALCKNALSRTQEKTALKLIDDMCGDTWCEGDNNFAFDHLTCQAANSRNGGSCRLELRIIPRDGRPRSYSRSCSTGAFVGFGSLVDTAQSGYQSLNWDYYLALTDCISQLETQLPH